MFAAGIKKEKMKTRRAFVFALGIFMLFVPLSAAPEETVPAPKEKVSHWEVSFAFIRFFASGQLSGIKSVGYYLVPRYLDIVVSLASVNAGTSDADKEAPLSLNASLKYPFFKGFLAPYITGGGGYSLTGTFITNAGGGLKIRVDPHTAVFVEYRLFEFNARVGGKTVKKSFDCLGIGLLYHD